MIERLMKAYDRAASRLATLNEAMWTAVEIFQFHVGRRRVPTFPLRCQHCDRPIRFATANHPASRGGGMPRVVYVDATERAFCYRGIPHRPMPSIR